MSSADRTKLLVHIRRISLVFENAIRNGPDGTLQGHFGQEHPTFVHHACGFYLLGTLSYLAGENSEYSWNRPSDVLSSSFDDFAKSQPANPKKSYYDRGISQTNLDALAEIRNAIAHNDGDLAKNRNANSLNLVTNAGIPGVVLTGSNITLESEFLEFVRVAAYAVRNFHDET